MKRLAEILLCAAAFAGTSCIENDVPYPVVELRIAGVSGEGFTLGGIEQATRQVTLRLDERTDIRAVKIDDVTFDATVHSITADKESLLREVRTSQPLTGTFDLRSPLYVTLSLYQDYAWTIRAEQEIERRFTVLGQIGATVFDPENRIATATVAQGTDLSALPLTELKLGPAEITTYSPSLEELSGSSFESIRFVDVTCHGRTERWTLAVAFTESQIAFNSIDLWNNTATVTAQIAEAEYSDASIRYRVKGTEAWKQTQKGPFNAGTFSAAVAPAWSRTTNAAQLSVSRPDPAEGVFAGRTYELQLLVGEEIRQRAEYTMPAGDAIPDGDLENGVLSCFTSDNRQAEFWASGNNTFASSLCKPGTFPGNGGSQCAKLTASNPPIVGLAAGNLMAGIFYKDGLTTGVVEFGQPYVWTARPTGLRVKYHATVGTVDNAKHGGSPLQKGDPDKARIMAAIVDWSGRHRVASGASAPTGTWDPAQTDRTDEGAIIAYASLFIERSTDGDRMEEIVLPFEFYDTQTRPEGRYTVVISCSTSAYGDFMVGCRSNVLYVDDFEWVY